MSKRAGTFVTLREVVDEVGPDPVRFMMRIGRTMRRSTLTSPRSSSSPRIIRFLRAICARPFGIRVPAGGGSPWVVRLIAGP